MTVDASIETARSANALVVSLTALNFRAAPPAPGSASSAAPPSPWGDTGASRTVTPTKGSRATVTVVEGGTLRSIPVRVILVSGGEAAIESVGQSLPVGSRIAVSVAPHLSPATTQQASATTRAPTMLR